MSALSSQQSGCLEFLLEIEAPSRLGAQDATLYSEKPEDTAFAQQFMGWTTLSSQPPFPIGELKRMAAEIRAEGLEGVVLVGQGGSAQAAMTITKLAEINGVSDVKFRTMDSLSPVFVNHILGSSDPAKTLYIVAGKSGSTIETVTLERVTWQYVAAHLGETAAAKRFVAITDPDTALEKLAKEKGYRYCISTPPTVGGRFSALTAFALFPAALVGIDIEQVIAQAHATENACKSEDSNNPALKLACFIWEAYLEGRDKVSLILPSTGQVFGLWVEQLVAESLGKDGKGILPNIEVDASILAVPRDDRCAITCFIGNCEGFGESVTILDKSIPVFSHTIEGPMGAFAHFIIWEYAVSFLGLFHPQYSIDYPDVEITKRLVREILSAQGKQQSVQSDDYCICTFENDAVKSIRMSKSFMESESCDPDQILRKLFGSLKKGDYFSLNAFVPFRGYGRREALERMRHRVASRLGVVSCLEIGPRYLHSTGQFHKGGPNKGVFLVLSADEDNDIQVPDVDYTLGELAQTQAQGDFAALAANGRRVIHIHLVSNAAGLLSQFADRVCAAISATTRPS